MASTVGGIAFDQTEHASQFVDVTSTSIGGSIVRNAEEAIQLFSETTETTTTAPTRRRRDSDLESASFSGRHLMQATAAPATTSAPPSVSNSMTCLELGESMIFRIRDPAHYPVYLKDHLLNSNPTFDDGPFRKLKDYLAGNLTIRMFVHVFTTAGTYIFANSVNSKAEVIVVVLPAGSGCTLPSGARVAESTSVNLIRLNVTTTKTSTNHLIGLSSTLFLERWQAWSSFSLWRSRSGDLGSLDSNSPALCSLAIDLSAPHQ